jgi:Chloroplast envelope transporter
MPREGLLARTFGRPPKEHAHMAIQNLLASTAIKDLQDDSILEILEHYRLDFEEARPKLKEIYGTVLRHFARDLELVDEEMADLRRLRILFGLNESDVSEIERRVLDPHYESTLREMLSDRRLSPEERGRLETLAKSLRLPASISERIQTETMTELVQRTLESAIADRRLSPEEDAELRAIADNLRANLKPADEATTRALDYFRLLWRLEQGDLPQSNAPIQLRKGEVCHLESTAGHSEFRSVTRSIRYGGPVARVRIMKGLYYRVGQVNVQRIAEDVLTQIDVGSLYLTNKRLIFNGSKKNTTIPLAKIINFEVYADGLKIEKETGKDQFFQLGGGQKQMEIWGATLRGALRASRE